MEFIVIGTVLPLALLLGSGLYMSADAVSAAVILINIVLVMALGAGAMILMSAVG